MENVYQRLKKRTKLKTKEKVASDIIILTHSKMEKENYSKEEVQQLIEPLMKQIEFYNYENIELKEYIRKNWIPFGDKIVFLNRLHAEETKSDTLIFNILNQWNQI